MSPLGVSPARAVVTGLVLVSLPPRLGGGARTGRHELHGLPQVQLTVSPLPALSEEDRLLCRFGDAPPHPALVQGDVVICNSTSTVPSTPPGQGEARPAPRALPQSSAGVSFAPPIDPP